MAVCVDLDQDKKNRISRNDKCGRYIDGSTSGGDTTARRAFSSGTKTLLCVPREIALGPKTLLTKKKIRFFFVLRAPWRGMLCSMCCVLLSYIFYSLMMILYSLLECKSLFCTLWMDICEHSGPPLLTLQSTISLPLNFNRWGYG